MDNVVDNLLDSLLDNLVDNLVDKFLKTSRIILETILRLFQGQLQGLFFYNFIDIFRDNF